MIKMIKIVSEYDQKIPHYKLKTNPLHGEEEPLNNHKEEMPF